MKTLLFIFLMLPLLTFAQMGGELTVGERAVVYDEMTDFDGVEYYYKDNGLAASKHGNAWLVYEKDIVVYEAHDTDDDGNPDVFFTIDSNENVVEIVGESAAQFERPEVIEFSDLLNEISNVEGEAFYEGDVEDLVGDLSSIKIPKYHNYTLYVFILIFLGGGYWWYRKKKV